MRRVPFRVRQEMTQQLDKDAGNGSYSTLEEPLGQPSGPHLQEGWLP